METPVTCSLFSHPGPRRQDTLLTQMFPVMGMWPVWRQPPPCLFPVRHGGHGAQEGFFVFYCSLSPQSVQYLSWNFFSCGSFSSVPSPMISSAFSFRIPLGLEFLSLPWLSISHFHFSIFWCFLYDISSSPWINSSINYSSLLFSLHIKVFLLPRAIFFITACSHLIISWSPCRGSLLSLPLQYITWH